MSDVEVSIWSANAVEYGIEVVGEIADAVRVTVRLIRLGASVSLY